MTSGLYEKLTKDGQLVRHQELPEKPSAPAYKILQPEQLPVISYPYEWSFEQLKDAALLTLTIQKTALERGQTLRDASAYNVQFSGGKPIFIDTLSFEPYEAGAPWVAYRQFCQHFLAPLALASSIDPSTIQALRLYIDGWPLSVAAKLLPWRSRLNPGLATHIYLHARFQAGHASGGQRVKAQLSATALTGLLENLERTISGLKLRTTDTEWVDYYDHTNYSKTAAGKKERLVKEWSAELAPKRAIDLGANNGLYSRLLPKDCLVISADIDPLAVNDNYQQIKKSKSSNLLPLVVDLTNPSPALGWALEERQDFGQRAKSDLALALALIHHLAIGNNVPLERVAEYLASLAPNLIIEFVPKGDSQVIHLLASREDIFPNYTPAGFEAAFGLYFDIVRKEAVSGSKRVLYLMKSHAHQ